MISRVRITAITAWIRDLQCRDDKAKQSRRRRRRRRRDVSDAQVSAPLPPLILILHSTL